MVAVTDKVIVELQAKVSDYNRDILNAQRRFQAAMDQMTQSTRGFQNTAERSMNASGAAISRMATRAAGAVAGVVALFGALNNLKNAADGYKTVENRLASIGQTGDEAGEKLLESALRSRSAIGEMAGAVARFEKAAGGGFDQSIRRVETLNKLLGATGSTTAEVSSVVTQLSQALTSGKLQGDELRSLAEAAPPELLQAIAEAAGVTRAELKKMGEEGKLTSDIVIEAIDNLATTADEKFAAVSATTGAAATNLTSAWTLFIGRLDEGLGASDRVVAGLQDMANWFASNAGAAEQLGIEVNAWLDTVGYYVDYVLDAVERLGEPFRAAAQEVFGIGDGMESVGDVTAGVIDDILGGLTELIGALGGASEFAEEAFLSIPEAVAAGFSGAINFVIERINVMLANVTAGINNVIGLLNNLPGVEGLGGVQAPQVSTVDIPSGTGRAQRSVTEAYAEGRDKTKAAMTGLIDAAVVQPLKNVKARYEQNKAQTLAGDDFEATADKLSSPPPALTKARPAPQAAPAPSGGGGRSRGGGGAGAKEYDINDSLDALKEETAALLAEAKALQTLDPLRADYELRTIALKKEQELLNEATKEGVTLTPANRDAISQLATGYAEAEISLERFIDKQEDAKRQMEEMREIQQGIFKDFASDLFNGASAAEALSSALKKAADQLLQMALNNIFSPERQGGGGFLANVLGGGGGGGGLGGFIAKAFGGFRASGGPVEAGKGYLVGEQGAEFIVPSRNEFVIPNHALRAAGGAAPAAPNGGSVGVEVYVNEDGNWQAKVRQISGNVSAQVLRSADKQKATQQYLGGR